MENATKALLIAAAVLIAIVIIALGVNLLNAGGDTAKQAEEVGSALEEHVGSAADLLIGEINKEQLQNRNLQGKLSKEECKKLWTILGMKDTFPTNITEDLVTVKFRFYINIDDEVAWNEDANYKNTSWENKSYKVKDEVYINDLLRNKNKIYHASNDSTLLFRFLEK